MQYPPLPRRAGGDGGFSLIEVLTVVAIAGVMAAVGLPIVSSGIRQYALNTAARNVAAEIRSARYAAVAKNRTLILRFNCPGTNQYRLVEFTGTPAIDDDADRCSLATYPYPDTTPNASPVADGPLLSLDPGTAFGATANLAFDATGRIPSVVTLEVTDGMQVRRLTVTPGGRITEQ
jgi:prepilin-type N-terminal cleavage/methylation domain-containing protein